MNTLLKMWIMLVLLIPPKLLKVPLLVWTVLQPRKVGRFSGALGDPYKMYFLLHANF